MDVMLIILILGILAASFQAWNIGANDVANAMGTSVGARSVTLKQAVIIAAIFEFAGAVLVGGHVTDTLRKGILDVDKLGNVPELLALGMLAALISAGVWLLLATLFGLPVSTTHSIVGAVVGIGIGMAGFRVVQWDKIGQIALSWLVSPLMGGMLAYLVFRAISRLVFTNAHPMRAFKKLGPFLIFLIFMLLSMSTLFKGLKNLHLNLTLENAILISLGISITAAIVGHFLLRRIQEIKTEKPSRFGTAELRSQYTSVESIFRYFQIMTACSMAFAHGSNDVANSIGPLVVIVSVFQTGTTEALSLIPMWIVLLGGIFIVIGLATYGYKVIDTIGKNITELTPSRGVSAEIAAASTILIGSKLGLPISTTHTLVGAVIGVGLAQHGAGGGVNRRVVLNIMNSWLITLPFTAILSMIIFFLLKFLLHM